MREGRTWVWHGPLLSISPTAPQPQSKPQPTSYSSDLSIGRRPASPLLVTAQFSSIAYVLIDAVCAALDSIPQYIPLYNYMDSNILRSRDLSPTLGKLCPIFQGS